jgi:hypothetical protein
LVRCALVRRALGIVLNVATALSLLLCAATVVLWVRSYRWVDVVTYRTEPTAPPECRQYEVAAGSVAGRLGFQLTRVEYRVLDGYGAGVDVRQRSLARFYWDRSERARGDVEDDPPVGAPGARGVLGFTADARVREAWVGNGITWRDRRLVLPYWCPLVLAAAVPTAALLRRRLRRRRSRRGLCPACGYDLRATPERCPECGAAPAAAPPVRTA